MGQEEQSETDIDWLNNLCQYLFYFYRHVQFIFIIINLINNAVVRSFHFLQGTIHPVHDFNAGNVAAKLRKAMAGLGKFLLRVVYCGNVLLLCSVL